MPDPRKMLITLRQAILAFRSTPGRSGRVVRLPAGAEVMVVGDGQNDVTALRAVGVPVAMRNADAEVLAVARHVVADVEEDGLVEALALALEPAALG